MAPRSDDSVRLLPLSLNTRAQLAIDGPATATFNTVIQATSDYEAGAGNAITLAVADGGTWVPNVGTLTLAANAVAAETVTIGTTVYTWVAAAGATAFEVEVGASASDSIDNLIAAINLGAGAGTVYGSATTEHTQVRAFAGAGDTMVVHTRPTILTAVGTLIATTETMTQGSWGAATLADGTDGDNVAFTVVGTAISCVFSAGYTCVEDFEAEVASDATVAALIEVATAGTTPLYQLATTNDEFAATALTGGGETTVAAPTAGDGNAGRKRPFYADEALVLVKSVAGSGTMTASPVIWGWHEVIEDWFEIGALNAAAAIAETTADSIRYVELLVGIGKFSRFACELASAGTAQEFEIHIDFVRPGTHD